MNYPGENKPLTVENAIEIISRLHCLYSDFPYNIEKTLLHRIIKNFKDHLWDHHPNHLYIATPSSLELWVGIIHTFLGGQNCAIDTETIKEALKQLSRDGKAEQN